MKNSKQKSFFYGIGFLAAFMASTTQADCNVELPFDQLVDCIVVEGSGETYNRADDSNHTQNLTKTNKDEVYLKPDTTSDIAKANQ